MTILDYGLIGIVVFSTAIGLMRGLVSEVIALAAWVLAFIAAAIDSFVHSMVVNCSRSARNAGLAHLTSAPEALAVDRAPPAP